MTEQHFVRYADDRNIFVASKRAGERVMESVIRFVEGKLKLKVNRDKSAVDRPWNRKFLGFSFLSNRQATIRLAPKTISRFKEKVREITNRTRPMPMEERIRRMNRYMLGWIGYFRLASAKKHCENFDQWIRRRLRMCLWKQWKIPKARLRNLRALGVPEWHAQVMANSRRGPWEMSRNTNNALGISFWNGQGFKSAVEKALHSSVNKSRPSVTFEQVWDKYTSQQSGASRRGKQLVIAASFFALMLFIAYQTPVMAYVEQFLKVTIINKGEKPKFEGHWGGAENVSVVASKEEVEKKLGVPVPWPTLSKDTEHLVTVAEGKGYNYSFSWGDRSYYLWARYKEETTPEFYTETAGTASEKDIIVQGVAAKLVTSSDFPGYQTLYFEKGNWKFMIDVVGRPASTEQTITKALISVADSIQ